MGGCTEGIYMEGLLSNVFLQVFFYNEYGLSFFIVFHNFFYVEISFYYILFIFKCYFTDHKYWEIRYCLERTSVMAVLTF